MMSLVVAVLLTQCGGAGEACCSGACTAPGTLCSNSICTCTYARSKTDDSNAKSQCLWWHEKTDIVYHQNTDGNPETHGSEFTAIAKSFATWQTQLTACGSLTLTEGPRAGLRTVGYDEKAATNENIVLFRMKKCTGAAPATDACWKDDNCGNAYDCWQHSNSAIAITTTSYHPVTGRILDSDIELNTPSYIFSTVDSPVCNPPALPYSPTCVSTDIQNTVTHEVGHVLGLGHINAAGSTMSPRADPGELTKRTLDCGSQKFICDVYPKGQLSRGCVVLSFDGALGKPKTGCQVAPGPVLALVALAGLLRRRSTRR